MIARHLELDRHYLCLVWTFAAAVHWRQFHCCCIAPGSHCLDVLYSHAADILFSLPSDTRWYDTCRERGGATAATQPSTTYIEYLSLAASGHHGQLHFLLIVVDAVCCSKLPLSVVGTNWDDVDLYVGANMISDAVGRHTISNNIFS
jgi:hypothetical protein